MIAGALVGKKLAIKKIDPKMLKNEIKILKKNLILEQYLYNWFNKLF